MYLYVSWECMFHFFRKCLDLFPTPPPPEIRSELNLIASLALLDDFGIKMLPVQVRLCENKLDLIRSCLDSSPTAYKSVHVVSLVFCLFVFICCMSLYRVLPTLIGSGRLQPPLGNFYHQFVYHHLGLFYHHSQRVKSAEMLCLMQCDST